MRAFVALLRKELRSYFAAPLVYLVAAAFLAYTGYYFHSDLIYFVTFGFGVNIMENFWQLLFIDIRLVLIFAIPLLTMRLFAEERRLGTLELLLTYPLRDGAIVAAKLGACLIVILTLLAGDARSIPRGSTGCSRSRCSRSSPATSGLVLLALACAAYGALRLVAHRQPGARRLPHVDAAAAPVVAVVERGRDRPAARCRSCGRSRSSTTSSPSRWA